MSQQTTRRAGLGLDVEGLGAMHWAVIGLSAITGAVHLYLFWTQGWLPFLGAGLGFLAIIAAIAVTRGLYRELVYLGAIPFTIAQIVGFYVVEQPQSLADLSTVAIVDKLVQFALIALLAYLFVHEWEGL